MSRKGDCWDNAVAESFFKTIKYEMINHENFRSRQEAEMKIFEYIEMFYNTRRLHSSIGYISPIKFEWKNLA
jgi:putative transposase